MVKRFMIRLVSAAHRTVYRISRGTIGTSVFGGPILLLTTVGSRSGRPRTVPLLYLEDGSDLILVGSYGGSHQHPSWWLNLRKNPAATVRVGRQERPVRGRKANEEERDRLWPLVVDLYPPYQEYQRRTHRRIPVVILEPQ